MNKHFLFKVGRPFSPLYSVLMRFRESCYHRSIFSSEKMPVPVISVGNLTLGGTGKTPMVQHLARLLAGHGFKPAIISRGYGGSTKKPVSIVSTGSTPLCSAEFVGDEPRFLAETLENVLVLTGVVRKLPARRAVEMGADVLLLDDGFQHMAVDRDLDIVLFSADYLAGNSRVFPGGDLREPVTALNRASCFVLTGVNKTNRQRSELFADLLRQRFPGKTVYNSGCQAVGFVSRDNNGNLSLLPENPKNFDKALAMCGIARPDSFQNTLQECGITPLDLLVMADHHNYKKQDLRKIREMVKKNDAQLIITTEKDMVKLNNLDLSVPVYGIRIAVNPAEIFNDMVLEGVREITRK
jgi:tetraacyldisaccharide 4'-kinase